MNSMALIAEKASKALRSKIRVGKNTGLLPGMAGLGPARRKLQAPSCRARGSTPRPAFATTVKAWQGGI